MPAVGIADSGNLFGSLEFCMACADAGIQPIVGCTLPVVRARMTKPEPLALIAADDAGYANLLSLVSESYLDPASAAEPCIALAGMEGRADGLLALAGAVDSGLGQLLLAGQDEAARDHLAMLQALFPDRLYIELQRHGLAAENRIEQSLIDLALGENLPLVATNDVYFLTRDMHEAHDALLCIASGRYVQEDDRRTVTPEHYFKSSKEMESLFADIPEAIENTVNIARRCTALAPRRKPMLPKFSVAQGISAETSEEALLQTFAREGLKKRLEHIRATSHESRATNDYTDRLEFELSVITRMGFAGYFLIVSDFIRWSKGQGIPVGPGRGSGAGSVVAWALEITDLDPLQFGLLFERFLNPDRVSMPDFDVDFCQDRRDEVIAYVQQKYGADKVAQIITFGKLQARAVLRDVGRVLQMPYNQVDRICKLVPVNPANPVDLAQALELEPQLKEQMRGDPQVQKLVDIGLKLEGLNRHASTHAAGIVIGDRPLQALVPMYLDARSTMPVVQYSMKYAEEAGLVKFDFLGLKTLTVIQRALELVRRIESRKSQVACSEVGNTVATCSVPHATRDLRLATLPRYATLDDPAAYALVTKGDTLGVFQLESAGMRDTLRKMRPDTIEDVIALISLYRPGPMEMIPTYIACKHGEQEPDYLHPLLTDILKETFGVIIYQEQVMQIAQVLAGYSLGQADLLRRAMGKKIKAEMDAQRDQFVNGAIEKKVDGKKAGEIFDLIAKFAGYGFNKSHAAAYALISYQTAYLKANYPVEFTAASMAYEIHDTDKLNLYRQDAQNLGITLLPPDINVSGASFEVTPHQNASSVLTPPLGGSEGNASKAVRYALGAIRNVGTEAMKQVVAERDKNGPFTGIYNFAERVDPKVMNRRQLEFLVKAGAFDSLVSNRRQAFEAIEIMMVYAAAVAEARESQQRSLFGSDENNFAPPAPPLPVVADWLPSERMQYEFEAVGFFLTGHPLDELHAELKRAGVTSACNLAGKLGSTYAGIKVAGIVTGKKFKVSAKGRFGFVDLSDPTGAFEVSLFDEQLINTTRELLENGAAIVISGEGKQDENGVKIIAQSIKPLDQALRRERALPETVVIVRAPGDIVTARRMYASVTDRTLKFQVFTEDGYCVELAA